MAHFPRVQLSQQCGPGTSFGKQPKQTSKNNLLGKGIYFLQFFKKEIAQTTVAQLVGVSSCELKGREFDSQSGHIPGLWVRSLVSRCKRQLIYVSLPLSLPSPPSLSKKQKQKRKEKPCFKK